MSYESLCQQLYEERLSIKKKQEEKSELFRQSILNRQNKNYQPNVSSQHPNSATTKIDTDFDFIMPDILPNDEAKLKWLIFQNIELIQNNPDRKAEGQQNIKRIKVFINEKKK